MGIFYPPLPLKSHKNWQAYEISKNNKWGNGLVIVKLKSTYSAPDEAYGIDAEWVNSFNEKDVIAALNRIEHFV